MEYSISITKINSTTNKFKNVRELTKDGKVMKAEEGNVALIDKDIRVVYDELFSESLRKYNSNIKRKSRQIDNYYIHVYNSKKIKTFEEIVVQVGNINKHLSKELAIKIYSEYANEFIKANKQFEVIGVYVHLNSATPHLHIDYIPYYFDPKIGLEKKVSNDGAIKQMGYSFIEWKAKEFKCLEKIMNNYGITREKMNNNNKHIHISLYAKYCQNVFELKNENMRLKEENKILKEKK